MSGKRAGNRPSPDAAQLRIRGWGASLLVVFAACSGPTYLVAGETVRDPGPPQPMIAVQVLAADDSRALAGAKVEFDGDDALADEAGTAQVGWYDRDITVRALNPGYEPQRIEVTEFSEEPVIISLEPIVLTGLVASANGGVVSGATVTLGERSTTTDQSGRYRISGALPGDMTANRAAWAEATDTWDGRADNVDFVIKPLSVQALRIVSPAAADDVRWAEFLEFADRTAVNAFVLDTKDESGSVHWDVPVPLAREIGAVRVFFDAESRLADMAEHGIYAITRIVTFQDNPLAKAQPGLGAINSDTGAVWQTFSGNRWLDPTDRRTWEYPINLGEAACEAGFDEIQFDYVRFPSDGPIDALQLDGVYDQATRVATIAAFLSEAKDRLNALGCAVAADVFAVTMSSPEDEGVGQRPEEISAAVDVISPMIYPTHYANGWLGFAEPNDHPREVVAGSLDDALSRVQASAIIRPWLQTSTYDTPEISLELDATLERDLGWMLWSSSSIFDPRWLPAAEVEPDTAADTSAG
ncbi:MAG: hypothetical protein OEM94_00355 [Acidimicrobiia bacterium]|nr:hypothetical protein [Acidimicrobiia bacterium]